MGNGKLFEFFGLILNDIYIFFGFWFFFVKEIASQFSRLYVGSPGQRDGDELRGFSQCLGDGAMWSSWKVRVEARKDEILKSSLRTCEVLE